MGIAENYLTAVSILQESYYNPTSPNYGNTGLLIGPLTLLIGHTTEIALKAILLSFGISETRILKGKNLPQGHNLIRLYRIVRYFLRKTDFLKQLDNKQAEHIFLSEKYNILHAKKCISDAKILGLHLEMHDLIPNQKTATPRGLKDYEEHLFTLNDNHDRPFLTRYPQNGFRRLPHPEILSVGAEVLIEVLKNRESELRVKLHNDRAPL